MLSRKARTRAINTVQFQIVYSMHMKFAFKIHFWRKHRRPVATQATQYVRVLCISTLMITMKCEMEKKTDRKALYCNERTNDRRKGDRERELHGARSIKCETTTRQMCLVT